MDDDALRELLAQPLRGDPPERARWWRLVGLGTAVVAVVAFAWVLTRSGEDATASSPSAGSSIVTTTSAVPTTTPVSSFQYPDGRIAGTLVYDPLADGVVMFGGWTVFRDPPVFDPWVFDLAAESWVSIRQTLEPSGRELAPAVFVESLGRVAVFGGTPEQTIQCGRFGRVLTAPVDVWYLDSSTRAWDRVVTDGNPPDRWGHSAVYVPDADVVLVFGGVSTELASTGLASLRGDTWLFDPTEAAWTGIETDIGPSPRACAEMIYDEADGTVLLWGGTTTSGDADRSVWRFDIETLEWAEFAPVDDVGPAGRWMHTMLVVDGSAVVIGGLFPQETPIEGGTTTSVEATNEVWVLDLASLRWEPRTPAPVSLWGHAAAAVDGLIVLSAFGSTVIYDPAFDVWIDVTPYDELDWPAERRLFDD